MSPLPCRIDRFRSRLPEGRRGFTLVELLVVVAVIAILAGLLLPALGRAKSSSWKTACLANLRQQGVAWTLYLDDNAGRFPDRRDLKTSLPGGWRPWAGWPNSDPRTGWSWVVLESLIREPRVFRCPAIAAGPMSRHEAVVQAAGGATNAVTTGYWMWRFDRPDDPVPSDNFWGRTVDEAVERLRTANNPVAGQPHGPSEVELVVDPYFPGTIPSIPDSIRGLSAHAGGRNRQMLDGHGEWFRDPRTR